VSPAKGSTSRARGGSSDAAAALRAKLGIALRVAAGLGAVWFALEGGEYGTFDLVRQSRTEAHLRGEIDSLAAIVDSLGKYHARLKTDPALQERIAREEFGMVRGTNELLYRFAEPDAPAETPSPATP
jgi:cell division protein FtsB